MVETLVGGRRSVLDGSKVAEHSYTGAVIEERRFDGARLSRIMHPPDQRIDAHAHDWPVLALYRMGDYREHGEDASVAFDGPSIVFQPAGAAHADEIGGSGLETLSIAFDPRWLETHLPDRTIWRSGGVISGAITRLAQTWIEGQAERVRNETAAFLTALIASPAAPSRPAWAEHADHAIESEASTAHLARKLDLHPAWLARAYRAWRGEGIAETQRRKRVEHAVLRLRTTAAPLADVALACGFCDQSHMNRAFRVVLGRTPLEVRREAALLAPISVSAAAG